MPGITRDFDAFRDLVVGKAAASRYFGQYDRTQLGSGKLFVVEKRPEDEPVCPTGRGISGEIAEHVELPPGRCVILDIRSSECSRRPARASARPASLHPATRCPVADPALTRPPSPSCPCPPPAGMPAVTAVGDIASVVAAAVTTGEFLP